MPGVRQRTRVALQASNGQKVAAMILILTVANDLHALTAQARVRAMGLAECFIVECDRIAQRDFLSYGVNFGASSRVLTSENRSVAVEEGTLLWFRTSTSKQIVEARVEGEDARAIIDNDCKGALTGLLATQYHGKWLSTPEATYRASDKIGQLKAAFDCGFRVPKTLVSQSRPDVLEFFSSCAGQVVAKTVVGASGPFLETVRIDDPAALDAPSFLAAPTIFQEYVPGDRHLRLNCFGDESFAALIRTEDVDWRTNLNVEITAFHVDPELHERTRRVLDTLGLEMGIIDIKLTPDGEPVWLEVNPQGQFLFLDALTDLRLVDRFASYLLAEHQAATSRT